MFLFYPWQQHDTVDGANKIILLFVQSKLLVVIFFFTTFSLTLTLFHRQRGPPTSTSTTSLSMSGWASLRQRLGALPCTTKAGSPPSKAPPRPELWKPLFVSRFLIACLDGLFHPSLPQKCTKNKNKVPSFTDGKGHVETWLGLEKTHERHCSSGMTWSDGTCAQEDPSYMRLKDKGDGVENCYRSRLQDDGRQVGVVYVSDNPCGREYRALCEVPCNGGGQVERFSHLRMEGAQFLKSQRVSIPSRPRLWRAHGGRFGQAE